MTQHGTALVNETRCSSLSLLFGCWLAGAYVALVGDTRSRAIQSRREPNDAVLHGRELRRQVEHGAAVAGGSGEATRRCTVACVARDSVGGRQVVSAVLQEQAQ